MQNAVQRLAIVVSIVMILIVVLLYLALRSLLDVAVVFTNVFVICMEECGVVRHGDELQHLGRGRLYLYPGRGHDEWSDPRIGLQREAQSRRAAIRGAA